MEFYAGEYNMSISQPCNTWSVLRMSCTLFPRSQVSKSGMSMADGRAVSIYIREWEPIICMTDTPFSVSLLNRSCREQSEGLSHIAHWYIMEHRHGCPSSGEHASEPRSIRLHALPVLCSILFYSIADRTSLHSVEIAWTTSEWHRTCACLFLLLLLVLLSGFKHEKGLIWRIMETVTWILRWFPFYWCAVHVSSNEIRYQIS